MSKLRTVGNSLYKAGSALQRPRVYVPAMALVSIGGLVAVTNDIGGLGQAYVDFVKSNQFLSDYYANWGTPMQSGGPGEKMIDAFIVKGSITAATIYAFGEGIKRSGKKLLSRTEDSIMHYL